MSRGWLNLHGHSHGRLTPLPRQTDVGVDAWDFRPVRLAEITAAKRARTTKPARKTRRAPSSTHADAEVMYTEALAIPTDTVDESPAATSS